MDKIAQKNRLNGHTQIITLCHFGNSARSADATPNQDTA